MKEKSLKGEGRPRRRAAASACRRRREEEEEEGDGGEWRVREREVIG